jgi:VanZ family protein
VGTARVLTVLYGTLLIVLAAIPRVEGSGIVVSDWVLHALAYGVFGGLLLRLGLGAVMAVGGASGFGLATEFLQMLIPYRSFEILDVVADSVGAFLVILIMKAGYKVVETFGRGES